MSPRSAEGYLVAVASGAAVADQAACTVNGDKTVNALDASVILKKEEPVLCTVDIKAKKEESA